MTSCNQLESNQSWKQSMVTFHSLCDKLLFELDKMTISCLYYCSICSKRFPCLGKKRYLLPCCLFQKHWFFGSWVPLISWHQVEPWLTPPILRRTTPSTLTRVPLWSWPLRARWSPPAPPSPSWAKATSRTSASALPRALRRRGTTGSPRSEEI